MDKAHLCKMTLYVRGAGMSLARIEVDTVALTYTRTYLHPDQLGSATAGTSQSGAVLWREQYAPYGDKLTAPTANDDLGSFTGHIDDDATTDMNLTYMQARYYDPGAGRFTSIDPVTFLVDGRPGMVNRYGYAFSDPVNNTDPTGMMPPGGGCVECMARQAIGDMEGAQAEMNSHVRGLQAAGATVAIIAVPGPEDLAIAGALATRGGQAVKGIFASRTLSASTKKAIKSHKRFIKEHKEKLKAYKKDPDKFDNKGFLRNAETPEQRQSIIDGRINHLKAEIETAKSNIRKLRNTDDSPKVGTRIREQE